MGELERWQQGVEEFVLEQVAPDEAYLRTRVARALDGHGSSGGDGA